MHNLRKSLAFSLLGFLAFSLSITSIGSAQEGEIPAQIKGLSAQVQGNEINLRWTPLTASEVTGYKIYYGPESSLTSGGIYYWEESIQGNVSSYSFKDLSDGKYYFAMTGVNASGSESAEYSEEVSVTLGTPKESVSEVSKTESSQTTSDTLKSAPETQNDFVVISAEPINPQQVVVTMSAPVMIQNSYNVLIIERLDTEEEMLIGSLSTSDNQITVTVHDARFVPGARYRLTVSSQVTDLQGNPVRSGITDTIEFETQYFQTSGLPQKEIFSETTPPPESNAETPEDQNKNTTIDNVPEETFAQSEAMNQEFPVSNEIDKEAPSDVQNLRYDDSRLASEKIITLFWDRIAKEPDLVTQKVYVEENGVLTSQVLDLGSSETSAQISVRPESDYKVTIVSIDMSGNESSGALIEFGTYLNKTGADYSLLYGFILIAFSISATLRMGRISIRS